MGKAGTNTGKTFDDEWVLKIAKAQSGTEKKGKRRFSEEQEQEICRLYVEDELSTYAIGKQLNCGRTTIHDILVRRQIKIRQSNYTGHSNGCNIFTTEEESQICEIYKSGKVTMKSLSEKFKCGKTTIRDLLIRHKVKL